MVYYDSNKSKLAMMHSIIKLSHLLHLFPYLAALALKTTGYGNGLENAGFEPISEKQSLSHQPKKNITFLSIADSLIPILEERSPQ